MMNPTICAAIRERKLLRLTYDGVPRLIEPHVHGASKEGNDLLRAWQREPSAFDDEWKLFRLDKALALATTDIQFEGPRPKYNPDDPAMKQIYCRL